MKTKRGAERRVILFTVAVLFSIGSLAADGREAIPVASIFGSSSTGAESPVQHLADGAQHSAWALSDDSSEGWAEFRFPEPYAVSGALLSGRLGPQDRVRIMYRDDGLWKPFYSGALAELSPAGQFVSLSFDRVVTDAVLLRLVCESGTASLSEASFTGEPASAVRHRLEPERIVTTDRTSLYFPADNLFDRSTRTVWRTELGLRNRQDEKLLAPYSVAEITRAAWYDPGEVTAYLERSSRIDTVKVFLSSGFTGRYSIEFRYSDGAWAPVAEIRPGTGSGWLEFPVEPDAGECDAVRVRAEGYLDGLCGLSELELWGTTGGFRGDVFSTARYLTRDGSGVTATCEVNPNGNKDTVLELIQTDTDGASVPAVELNGTRLPEPEASGLFGGGPLRYRVLSYPVGPHLLGSGTQYLTVSGGQGEPTECRLRGRGHDGGIRFSGLPGGRFTADETGTAVLSFETAILQDISVLSGAGDSPELEFSAGEDWTPVQAAWCADGLTRYRCGAAACMLRLSRLVPGTVYELQATGSPVTTGDPEIRFLDPTDGACIASEDLSKTHVVGFLDSPEATVWVNGKKAHQKGHYFWLPGSLLPLLHREPESLTARLVMPDGREVQNTISVHTGDTNRFSLDQSGTLHTDAPKVTLTGTVKGGSLRIECGGAQARIRGKTFTIEVPVNEGFNLLRVTCTDRQGRMLASVYLHVVRYAGDTALTVLEPADGTYTAESEIQVSGYAAGCSPIAVTVNGLPAEFHNGIFVSRAVPLTEGENTITVRAEDANRNCVERTIRLVRDTSPPRIDEFFPPDLYISNSSAVECSVSASDDSPFWVFVNGSLCLPSSDRLVTRLQFADGRPKITLTAIDAAGRRTEIIRSITVDTQPPLPFTVTADPSGWTNDTRPVVSFETTDATSGVARYECLVDEGEPAVVTNPYRLQPLADGVHSVTIRAVDRAGWTRFASTEVYIDTVAPATPDRLNLIPGNREIELLWTASDPDTREYRITRTPAWVEGPERSVPADRTSIIDTEVENGLEYSYSVTALDRAYNPSVPTPILNARAGLELAPYEPESGAVAEYEGVRLEVLPHGLPESSSAVSIEEMEGEVYHEAARFPIVGTVLRIDALDADGNEVPSHALPEPYLCAISYDPASLPSGFPEENLGVYYFEPLFGTWIRIESSAVDTDTDTIVFSSTHFTDFSVQATAVREQSPEELRNVGYSPFRTYLQHETLSVSPQGGTALTTAVDLVLPGPAGFDLVLRRRYDFSIAQMDGRLYGVEWALPYAQDQADLAYSFGQGWRLDLPSVKTGSGEPSVVLPGGSVRSLFDLAEPEAKDLPDGNKSLTFSCRDEQCFTVTLELGKVQRRVYSSCFDLSELPHYDVLGTTLTMSDGTVYEFDGFGRLSSMRDPSELNRIIYRYVEDSARLEQIEDALGRTVLFEYAVKDNLPFISKISVLDDPYDRSITYLQDEKGLLSSVTDAGGRLWSYRYTAFSLSGSRVPFPYDLKAAVKAFGDTGLIAKLSALETGVEHHTVHALTELSGPGTGTVRVSYAAKRFEEQEHTRIYATQVRTYHCDADADREEPPVRMTTYNYTFTTYPSESESGKKEDDSEDDSDDDRILITSVEELEEDAFTPHGRTVYEYGIIEQPRRRWTVKVFGSTFGQPEPNDEDEELRPAVTTRMVRRTRSITVTDGNPEYTVLSGESLAYPASDTLRPSKTVQYTGASEKGAAARSERSFTYDGWGNLITLDELNLTTVESETIRNRLTKRFMYSGTAASERPAGFSWYDTFSADGQPDSSARKDLLLAELTLNYAPRYEAGSFGDGEGTYLERKTYYTYNELGQRKSENRWSEADGRFVSVVYRYDNESDDDLPDTSFGTMIEMTADHLVRPEDGSVERIRTRYTYDESGFPVSETIKTVQLSDTHSEDIVRSFQYEQASGWKLGETDPRGYRTGYRYDALGRVIEIVHPDEGDSAGETRTDNPVTTILYEDAAGSLSSTVSYLASSDDTRRKTRYEFDDLGNLVCLTQYRRENGGQSFVPAAVTTLTHNRFGVMSITDPNGNDGTPDSSHLHTTRYEYDAFGRQSAVVYPDLTEPSGDNPRKLFLFEYDASTLTTIDEEGHPAAPESLGHRTVEILSHAGAVLYSRRYDGVSSEPIVVRSCYDGEGRDIGSIGPRPDEVSLDRYDSLGRLVESAAPPVSVYEPLSVHDTTAEVSSLSPSIRFEYSLSGHKLREISPLPDEAGRPCFLVTEYRVNELGWVLSETRKKRTGTVEAELSSKKFEYDASGNTIAVTDGNGHSTRYRFDVHGNVLEETAPDRSRTTYTYYADGTLRSALDGRYYSGNYTTLTEAQFLVEYFYDDLGRLVRAELPPKSGGTDRVSTSFTYDARGNVTCRTDPDGRLTSWTYLPRDRVETETVSWNGTSLVTRYRYDNLGNIRSITDPRNCVETREYDGRGQLVKLTRPEGGTERYRYDAAGNMVSQTDGNDSTTRYAFDLANRVIAITYPGNGGSDEFFYDRAGRLTRKMNAERHEWRYGYHPEGLLATELDPLRGVASFTYDRAGNLTTKTDAAGTVFSYSYTETDLPESITAVNGTRTESMSYGYDEAGAIIFAKSGEVSTYYNGYDPVDRDSYTPDPYGRIVAKTTVTGSDVSVVRYGYDAGDRVTSLTYPNGRTVRYSYSPLGELTELEGFLGGSPVYDRGLLASVQAANSIELSREYDSDSRLSGIVWSGAAEGTVPSWTYRYDDAGNLRFRTDGEGRMSEFRYDDRSRLSAALLSGTFMVSSDREETRIGETRNDLFGTSELVFSGEAPHTRTVEGLEVLDLDYASGSVGLDLMHAYQISRILLTPLRDEHRVAPEKVRIFVSPDNSFSASEEVFDASVSFIVEEGLRRIQILLPEGVWGRFVKVKTGFDERDLESFSPVNRAEFYNEPERLVTVFFIAESRTERYTYDRIGNRTSGSVSVVHTDEASCLYYARSSRLLTDGTFAYAYDATGNLVRKGTHVLYSGAAAAITDIPASYWTGISEVPSSLVFTSDIGTLWDYEFDLFGRLVAVSVNGRERVRYGYDADGYRVLRIAEGRRTGYSYSIGGALLYEAAGDEYVLNVYLEGVLFAKESGVVGSPDTERLYCHTDHLGSLVALSDSTGSVVWHNEYTPYGGLYRPGEAEAAFRNFTGKDYDPLTGLYYFNARWYDPETARFITEDPIRDGENWYAYCGNNPLVFVDPTGLMGQAAALAAAEAGFDYDDSDSKYGHTLVEDDEYESFTNLEHLSYKLEQLQKQLAEATSAQARARQQYAVSLQERRLKEAIGSHLEEGYDQRGIRRNTEIRITRDQDFQKKLYDGQLDIIFMGASLFSASVQTWPDWTKNIKNAQLMPDGTYTGYLIEKSGTYMNPILLQNPALGIFGGPGHLIHPDARTNPPEAFKQYTQPFSLGCQIPHLGGFNLMTSTLKQIGYQYKKGSGYADTGEIWGDPYRINVRMLTR